MSSNCQRQLQYLTGQARTELYQLLLLQTRSVCLMFALARQLSRDVSEDVGVLCDKADVLEKTNSGNTLWLQHVTCDTDHYSRQPIVLAVVESHWSCHFAQIIVRWGELSVDKHVVKHSVVVLPEMSCRWKWLLTADRLQCIATGWWEI